MTKKRAQQPAPKVAKNQAVVPRQRPQRNQRSEGVSMPQGSFSKPTAVAAAYSSGKTTREPKIFREKNFTRIVHEEMVMSVVGSDAFTVAKSIALNPGLPASFPWLATQAQGWERYRFRKLRFCYYTRNGSTLPGSCMLVPDYDAADAAPVSEQIASAYQDRAEDVPWKNICCTLRPSAMNAIGPSRYVRTGALAANQDVKTYDVGNLFVCTVDGTDNAKWGKLWVEYDIELITPQLNPAGGGVIAAQAMTSATPTTANMLDTPTTVAGSAPIVTVAGEVVSFLVAGKYYVTYWVTGTTCTQTGVPVAGASGVINTSSSAGSGTATMMQYIEFTSVVGSTLTFNNTLVAGTGARFVCSQLPSNLGTIA